MLISSPMKSIKSHIDIEHVGYMTYDVSEYNEEGKLLRKKREMSFTEAIITKDEWCK